MRLAKWTVKGYKSIPETTIDFNSQVLLVGKNDSGKSNLLDSLDDYQRLFGNEPSSFSWSDNTHYDDWWGVNKSRYEEGEIAFIARFEPDDENEREQLTDAIKNEFDMAPGWKENRIASGDFSFFEHHLTLTQTGLQNEVLYSSIGGQRIPLSIRKPGTNIFYHFLYEKANVHDEDQTYSNVSDLTAISPDEIDSISIGQNQGPRSGVWYRKAGSQTVNSQVGGILSAPLWEAINSSVSHWSKVDAFRVPKPIESPEGHNPGDRTASEEAEIKSDMENLVDYLVDIDISRESQADINVIDRKYRSVIEGVSDIELRRDPDREDRAQTIVVTRWGEEFKFELISDGSMQAICLVTQLHKSGVGSELLLIEEPEAHLHASAIRSIWEYIETLVEEENIQLAVSTHSRTVVNCSGVRLLHLFARDEETKITEAETSPIQRTIRTTDRTVGELIQAEAAVFVDGEFTKHLLKSVCIQMGISPGREGLEFFAISGSSEKELNRFQPLFNLFISTGIPSRLILPETDENESNSEHLRDWKETHDTSEEILDYVRVLKWSPAEWIAENCDAFVEVVAEQTEHDFDTDPSEFANAILEQEAKLDSGLSLSDIVSGLQEWTGVSVYERDVVDGLQDFDFDQEEWENLYHNLQGLL